jgi:hypothetical protein
MDFTVTITAGAGPIVEAGVSVNLSPPLWLPLGLTQFMPPNQFRFIQGIVHHQSCGKNIGGQYRFTDNGVQTMSGFVLMLCGNC